MKHTRGTLLAVAERMPQEALHVAWKCLCTMIFASVILGGLATSAEAQETQDVVYLKDGSIIRGTIVEQVPGESILIQTVDGNRFRYLMEEIERMVKEPRPNQGTGQARPRSAKSPGTAVLLSLVIPGGGQGYNGEWGKAALFFGGAAVFAGALVEAADSDACKFDDNCEAAGAYALGLIAVLVWSVVDAHKSAKAINERLTVAGLEFTPRPSFYVSETPYGRRVSLDVQLLSWVH